MIEFHPGIIMLIGALLAAILPHKLRQIAMIAAPLLALFALLQLQEGIKWVYPFLDIIDLVLLKVDGLSWVFGLIFCIIALLSNIYAVHIKKRYEIVAGLIYPASTLGVVFAGDWITLIVFWEIMAISSTFMVWNRENPKSIGAGFRYFLVHTLGGNVLLAGIFLKVLDGNYAVAALTGVPDVAFWLILFGVAINTAIPPLHAWIADAYPEGTPTSSVFLCAFTTKLGVYALIRMFPGFEPLIWIGVIMAIYGVIYAIIENDIRRLLSYHIVSQVGFMVAGVGIGTELALNGAAAHAFGNILFKSLLFMACGAVMYATGFRKLTDLGGLYKKMPLTLIFFAIGAFAISGVPYLNGFISKPMILSAAAYENLPSVELLLYFASIGTFLSIAAKLKYFMFFGKDKGIEIKRRVPFNMHLAMTGNSLLCIMYGLFPLLLYTKLPYDALYDPYTLDHVIAHIQVLLAALVAFWLLIGTLTTKPAINLDTDWVYRKPLAALIFSLADFTLVMRENAAVVRKALMSKIKPYMDNPFLLITQRTPVESDGKVGSYDENLYRFPTGLVVFLSVFLFMVTITYIMFYLYG